MISGESKGHLLVVDDDPDIAALIADIFQREGYRVTAFAAAEEALTFLRTPYQRGVDVILSDLQMARMDGMQLLATVKAQWPEIPVVIVTAYASLDSAIEAMRAGAYHYLTKPFKLEELLLTVERCVEHHRLCRENEFLRREVKRTWGLGDVLGKSAAMRGVFDLITRVAPSSSNVLITGESGTGKELVARAIHSQGARASGPFIAVNCAAIPETLLESELFGHAKGAFTGAVQRKKGLVEEAGGGTLFLDEIGDMPTALQAKLLRVIQDREVRAVGDTTFQEVDVRFIAATHRDLRAEINDKRFREDLYYRLSVIPLVLPPLRERPEDVPLLVEHFLTKFIAAAGPLTRVRSFTPQAMAKLMSFRWRGNVRELENLVERIVVLCPNAEVGPDDVPNPDAAQPASAVAAVSEGFPTLAELEQRYIRMVMDRAGGRKDRAAKMLGINRRTLYRKEREYGWVLEDLPWPDEHEEGPSDLSQ